MKLSRQVLLGAALLLSAAAANAQVSPTPRATPPVTYDQLLTILHVYGFTAVPTTDGYIRVVPLAMVRMEPLPIVSDT